MLVTENDLDSYFKSSILSALSKQQVDASEHTVVYLSSLLVHFSQTNNLFEKTEDGYQLKPLALYYADYSYARNAQQRSQALRRLGDVALFICGLYSQSLSRKAVDIDYYIAMGGGAYAQLSHSVKGTINRNVFTNIFAELSSKFVDYMDVLSDITAAQHSSDSDILRQYEVWLRSGSKAAKKRLVSQGIYPLDSTIHTKTLNDANTRIRIIVVYSKTINFNLRSRY